MIKRVLILMLFVLSAGLVACAPAADEGTSATADGRLVTIFASPT